MRRRQRRKVATHRTRVKRSPQERESLKSLNVARETGLRYRFPSGGRCKLCGKLAPLVSVTECCGRVACYVLKYEFFMSKRSCLDRHSRMTLCGYHHAEGHAGDWKICEKCRKSFEPELYIYYGTNKYNFEKLENPPAYEPTHCIGCGRVIVLSKDTYSSNPDGSYSCAQCWED